MAGTLSAGAGGGGYLGPVRLDLTASGTEPATVADWDLTLWRYFFVDYDNGDDANVGFVDAAAGTTFAVGGPAGTALRTYDELFTRLPRLGGGRNVKILARSRAAGATYLNAAGAVQDVDFSAFLGYAQFLHQASTDLSNTVTDRITAGAIAGSTGPNADGSWTVAAGSTTLLVNIAAGALPAEPAIIGMRLRFKGNVTAALVNATVNVGANAAGSITISAAGVAPAAGDEFFIERPGLRVNTLVDSPPTQGGPRSDPTATVVNRGHCGVATVSTAVKAFVLGSSHKIRAAFCEQLNAAGANAQVYICNGCGTTDVIRSFLDETQTERVVGSGLRVNGDYRFENVFCLGLSGFAHVNTAAVAGTVRFIGILCSNNNDILSGASYLAVRTGLAQIGFITPNSNPGTSDFRPVIVGAGSLASTNTLTRAIGGITFQNVNAGFEGIDITNAGASSALAAVAPDNSSVSFDSITGATGNTGFGIDLVFTSGPRAVFGTRFANTVTGTLGDVRLDGSAICTHGTFAITNVRTRAGVECSGNALTVVGPCILVTNQSGVALTEGAVVRSNGVAGEVTRAQANTSGNATGPLLVMVTPPANGAPGYAVPLGGGEWVNFDVAPAAAALAYLDEGTAGVATTTVPPAAATNQKRRLGHVMAVSGTRGRLVGSPELLPILSDGVAP
jgi:hypothetical protein